MVRSTTRRVRSFQRLPEGPKEWKQLAAIAEKVVSKFDSLRDE